MRQILDKAIEQLKTFKDSSEPNELIYEAIFYGIEALQGQTKERGVDHDLCIIASVVSEVIYCHDKAIGRVEARLKERYGANYRFDCPIGDRLLATENEAKKVIKEYMGRDYGMTKWRFVFHCQEYYRYYGLAPLWIVSEIVRGILPAKPE